MTFHNAIDLFTLVLKTSPYYVLFLIPIFFVWIFFVLTFIIGMLNHYFVRVVRDSIKRLDNYPAFKKVFEYFCDERGIVDHWRLDQFITDFFKNPSSLDFAKYESTQRKELIRIRASKNVHREAYCNLTRQHPSLPSFQTHFGLNLLPNPDHNH